MEGSQWRTEKSQMGQPQQCTEGGKQAKSREFTHLQGHCDGYYRAQFKKKQIY